MRLVKSDCEISALHIHVLALLITISNNNARIFCSSPWIVQTCCTEWRMAAPTLADMGSPAMRERPARTVASRAVGRLRDLCPVAGIGPAGAARRLRTSVGGVGAAGAAGRLRTSVGGVGAAGAAR